MRREILRMPWDRALELLRRAWIVHLASTTEGRSPVLRALDAAVLDDVVAFHGSMASAVPSRKARSAPGLRP